MDVNELKALIEQQLMRAERGDKSSEWNKGFDACCKFILKSLEEGPDSRYGHKKGLEYWCCVIGPMKSESVPWDGDGPLRAAVKAMWEKMFGEGEEMCSSGWGVDYQEMNALARVRHDAFWRRVKGDRA